MGEFARNAVTLVLVAAGALLVAYLIWVAATSKSFLLISLTSLITFLVAFVLVVAVLAVIGVLAWWAALLIGVASSIALLAALTPVGRFGLSRLTNQLKQAFPSHWAEGEASGKMTTESMTKPPTSLEEARRMHDERRHLAEKAHVAQNHVDGEDSCLAFGMAFQHAFWDSLRSSGLAAEWSRRSASRHLAWRRKRT